MFVGLMDALLLPAQAAEHLCCPTFAVLDTTGQDPLTSVDVVCPPLRCYSRLRSATERVLCRLCLFFTPVCCRETGTSSFASVTFASLCGALVVGCVQDCFQGAVGSSVGCWHCMLLLFLSGIVCQGQDLLLKPAGWDAFLGCVQLRIRKGLILG
jgi:hypothetical protein